MKAKLLKTQNRYAKSEPGISSGAPILWEGQWDGPKMLIGEEVEILLYIDDRARALVRDASGCKCYVWMDEMEVSSC